MFLFDWVLRRSQGIVVYSHTDDDLLRIAVRIWGDHPIYIDGIAVVPGQRIIELHLWNEHLTAMGGRALGLAWGARLRCRFEQSLFSLATRLDKDPRLAECVAIRAEIIFLDRQAAAKFERAARHFGLTREPAVAGPGWAEVSWRLPLRGHSIPTA